MNKPRLMADVSLSFAGERMQPLRCGALFWPARNMLLVADMHLEKGSAFARRGWMLPPHDSLETLQRLAGTVQASGASSIAVLGDSFHDREGPERLPSPAAALLQELIGHCDWLWVTGNHDGESGAALGGRAVAEERVGPLWLRHQADASCHEPEISGHFHPKVSVALRTGRRVSRPCFALAGQRLVLPAYGAYAGGLSVTHEAMAQSLGAAPDAILPTSAGLLHVPALKPETMG